MPASKGARYAQFLVGAAVILAVLWGLGVVPTRRLAGGDGVFAMFAGCAISFISAALAGALVAMTGGDTPEARMQRWFLSMVVRLAVVVACGAAAVFSGLFPRQALLFWIAVAYVALLPLEVRLALL